MRRAVGDKIKEKMKEVEGVRLLEPGADSSKPRRGLVFWGVRASVLNCDVSTVVATRGPISNAGFGGAHFPV